MKKIYILFLGAMSITALHAQVPNGSFEQFTGYGNETRFWGAQPMVLQVSIDPNGNTVADQIQFAPNCNSTCFYIEQPYDGNRAMEIRNAFNVTQNQSIPGKMILFNEEGGSTIPTGWNTGSAVSPDAVLERLGFYYKFFPVNGDRAHAKMEVFDAAGESIGTATTLITGTHSSYTYVYSYLYMDYNKVPAFMTVEFYMSNPSGTTSLDSRFIVDRVVTNANALGTGGYQAHDDYRIYPTLVDDAMEVVPPTNAQGNINYKVYDLQGKIVWEKNEDRAANYVYKMDLGYLSPGVYLLQIESNTERIIKKFMKK